MRRLQIYVVGILVVVLASLFFGCSKKEPVDVSFSNICTESNSGEAVRIEGYFFLSDETACHAGACTIGVSEDTSKKKWFSAKVEIGQDQNQMAELKEGYTEKDLLIKENKGKTIGTGDKVRLTGEMWIMGDKVCRMDVDKIEHP